MRWKDNQRGGLGATREGEMRWKDNPGVALFHSLGEAMNQKHMLQCAPGHGNSWDLGAGCWISEKSCIEADGQI